MADQLKIKIVGSLNTGATIGEINTAIKGIEKKIASLKLNITVDEKVSKTLSDFSKAMENHKKIAQDLNRVIKEEKTITKDADGTIREKIRQHLKSGEIIDKEIEKINKKNKATKQEQEEIGKLISEYDKLGQKQKEITRQNAKGQVTGGSEKYRNNFTDTTYKSNKDGKLTSTTTVENLDQQRKAIEQLNQKLLQLKQTGEISEKTLQRMATAINSTQSVQEIDKIRNRLNTLDSAVKTRQSNKEIEKQIELYKRSAEIQARTLQSSHSKTVNNADLNAYLNSIRQLNAQTPQLQHRMRQLALDFREVSGAARESARSSMTVMDAFRTAMVKFPVWMAATTAFYGSLNSLKSTVGIIVDIDTKLTNLKKVMDEDTNFTHIMESARVSAERFGKTLSEVMDAYTEFARQGYKEKDLVNLGDAGLITSNVGELSSAKAAEYLTSAMVQFKLETKDSMKVIDAWNNISNKNATTVEKMAQGMAKAGATANAFGLDMNELNAIVGTVTASTKQSGTEVGNFIKSSLPRLLSKPGQDALSQAGVSFIDQKTGDMRDILDIYKDVSVQLQSMSKIEKNMILEGLAGKFHISRMTAFLDNFSMYEKMLKESQESQGSASRENEKYMESLQARINKMKQSFEELALAMGETFVTEGFIQSLQGLKSVGDGISGIVKVVGGLPLVLGTATLAVGLMSKSFRGLLGTGSILNGMFLGIGASATGMGLAARTALASTGIGAIAVVAGMGISHLLKKMGEARERVEEFESKNRELASSYTANKSEVSDLSAEYERLSKVLSGTDYSLEDLAKFNNVRNQLAQLMPELVQGEDQYGNKLIGTSDKIKSQIGLIEAQIVAQEKLDALKNKEEAIKNKGDLEKSIKDKEKELNRILNVSTTNVLGSDGDLKEVVKIYDSLNEKIANGEKLTMADSFNHEKAKEVIDNLKMTEAELGSLRGSYQKSIMDMIDANVTLDENTSKTTKGLINDFSLFVATSKMGSNDITGVFDNTLKALDNKKFTGVLESYGKAVEKYQEKINGGYSAEKLEDYEEKVKSSFTEVKKSLINLLPKGTSNKVVNEITSSLTQSGNAALMSSIDFEKLAKSTGMSTEELKASVSLASDASEGLDEVGDSAEGASGDMDKLTTATERLMGVADSQIESIYEMISTYELLSQMESLSAEQKTMLADATSFLASVYPDLVNGSQANVEMMKNEIEATDVLRQAIDKMANGEVSAQDAMTISAAIGTKNRLNLLRTEIQEYNKAFSDMNHNADMLGAEKLAMRKLPTIQIDIDSLMADMDNYTGTISSSLDINGKYTQATKDATEAQKKQDKELEHSIFIADKYKNALEQLTAELEKQRAIKSKFPDHSKDYQNALKQEIKLLEQQKKLTQEQSNSLSKQIKSGNITQYGVVASSLSSSSSSSASSIGGGTYSGKYSTEINAAASKYGINPFLVASIIQNESSFTPNARSGAGARGLMQLMPATAKELGVNNSYDPAQNIMGGTKYIAQQLAKFSGDIQKALYAYNAGAGNVSKIVNSNASSWKGAKSYADKVINTFNSFTGGVSAATTSAVNTVLAGWSGQVTSKYGMRNGEMHRGIDIDGRTGDRLDANVSGKVVASGTYGKGSGYNNYGNVVVVQDEAGMKHLYAHLEKSLVKVGDTIAKGQQVGTIGNTGDSNGSHLHYEVRKNGVGSDVDPTSYYQNNKMGNSASTSKTEAERLQSIDQAKSDVLSMEQEVNQINQQIQELYLAVVNSNLAAIDHVKNSYEDDIAKIDLIQNTESKFSKKWMDQQVQRERIYAYQAVLEKQAIDYLKQQIQYNTDLSAAQKDMLSNQLIDRQKEFFSLEQRIYDTRIAMAEEVIDTYKKALETQKDASLKVIDKMLDEINKKSDEADYKKKLSNAQKSRQEIQDEINKLSIDDSNSAKKMVADLKEQLSEEDSSISDMQEDRDRELQIDNLNLQKETITSHFDSILNNEAKFAQMRANIVAMNTDQIYKDLIKFSQNVKSNMNILGTDVVNNLVALINRAGGYIGNVFFKPIKPVSLDTGGMTGKWGSSGKMAVLHEEEMVSNKFDTKTLLKALDVSKNILSNVQMPKLPDFSKIKLNHATSTAGATYNLNLNIDNLTGDQAGANLIWNKLANGLKTLGG